MQTTRKQARGGISHPPVEELTNVTGSTYGLVNVAAKRTRQLVEFHDQLGEGLLEYAGPVVTPRKGEKPLTTALREIHGGLVKVEA